MVKRCFPLEHLFLPKSIVYKAPNPDLIVIYTCVSQDRYNKNHKFKSLANIEGNGVLELALINKVSFITDPTPQVISIHLYIRDGCIG